MSSGFGRTLGEWVGDDGFVQQPYEVKLDESWGPGGAISSVEFPDGSSLAVHESYGMHLEANDTGNRVWQAARGKSTVEIVMRDASGAEQNMVFSHDTDSRPLAALFIGQAISQL